MLGSVSYGPSGAAKEEHRYRKSLFAVKDIVEGEKFTLDNVQSIRPGGGLHTRYLDRVLKCTAAQAIARGTPLAWEHCSQGW